MARARCVFNLASVHRGMGDYAAALEGFNRAANIIHPFLGDDHPDVATFTDSNIASVYRDMGNYAMALPLAEGAVESRGAAPYENYTDYAQTLMTLAMLYAADPAIGQGCSDACH